jgi:2-succinyl-6-hydroxy-2,4-cyclohexadiene-1-carboxylate synthase
MEVLLVHGFCGLPQDWDTVRASLLEKEADIQFHTPNLWRDLPPSQFSNLKAAAEKLAHLYGGKDLTVVGYSLGGRIVSHWPQSQWSRIKKMILISTHGGLSSLDEKSTRKTLDQTWAERFLNEPWNKLLADWNQQPVFAGDAVRPTRQEKDFDRKELAFALRSWSLSSHEGEEFQQLSQAPFAIEYVVGKNDSKFFNYAEKLHTKRPNWKFRSLSAGHSLHLSHASELAEIVLSDFT